MVTMHVVAPCEFGGLERVVQMLGAGFGSLGHEVHVVSVVTESGAAEAFHGPLSEAGVATHEIVLSARSYARERAVIADRKSTRLNSSHSQISYAVFCLKKK